MDKQLWETLKPRLKSFGWRLGCYIVVALLGFVAQQLELFHLSPSVLAFVSLILGEITKWVNNHTTLFGAKLK